MVRVQRQRRVLHDPCLTPVVAMTFEDAVFIGLDLIIEKDGSIQLKTDGTERTLSLQALGAAAKAWQKDQEEDTPVLITAEKSVSYESVMKAMDALQRAGVQRVGLTVRSSGN